MKAEGFALRAIAVALSTLLAGTPAFAHDDDDDGGGGGVPIDRGSLRIRTYDGITDDLLSAGLNAAGLSNPVPPGFVDPLKPTPAELRRRAFHGNYRGIIDTTPGGGMGVLWGPGSLGSPTFAAPVVPGLIPGVEYKAYLRLPERSPHVNNVPAAVQIPRHFNPDKPCIVAAMPSGSRSLYGAIGAAEWALFKGCAVALPGKGTDTGFHLLGAASAAYAVDNLDGEAKSVDELGEDAQFAVRDTRRLEAYDRDNPNRVATKHAHSQINPERLWGEFGLQGIEFAFWALNDHFRGRHFSSKNTVVIAAGASNGGGMALRALEADHKGLIDGVVVTEPQIASRDGRSRIQFGDDPAFNPQGRSLYDSVSLFSVYASCAAHAPGAARTLQIPPFIPLTAPQAAGIERCTSLAEKGLIQGTTLAQRAESAREKLREHGYYAAQDWGIASHDTLTLWRALQLTYANAYGRFPVEANLCGMSLGATNAVATDPNFGRPVPMSQANAEKLFADSSGVPATAGVSLIADSAANGPINDPLAVSRSTGRVDLNFDAALCFRFLETRDWDLIKDLELKAGEAWANYARVQHGAREVLATAKLRGKPTLIIHGREDALVFPNLHSRAYYALNQEEEGKKSEVRYIEVTPAQHFDAFVSSLFLAPDASVQFAPLHHYYVKGMDVMYARLTSGGKLPPSQVVRPTPRGFQPYTAANAPTLLPDMKQNPLAGDRISYEHGVLTIPK